MMRMKRNAQWTVPRWLPPGCLALAGWLSLGTASALDLRDPELSQQILLRCYYYVGEFGEAGVRACVDDESAALDALADYPQAAQGIVARCTEDYEASGWQIVKRCADNDIEAHAALERYPPEHAAALEKCRQQFDEKGSAKVKACVDREIGKP